MLMRFADATKDDSLGGVDAGCEKGRWESSGSDCLPNGSHEPSLARMPCQRTAFLKDKAIAGLRTGRALKKSFFAPHPSGEARGCGRLGAGVLSATAGG